MYDWPEVQAHNDQFWKTLREALQHYGFNGLPPTLTRPHSTQCWTSQNNGLSQTCGYPLKHELGHLVELLGTPTYDTQYCNNGYYASVILTRREDSRSSINEFQYAKPAVNGLNSQSGYNALVSLVGDMKTPDTQQYFASPLISGSHRQSILAVAERRAELCAVDPVSWKLAQQFEKASAKLSVLCLTSYTPALPLISSTKFANRFSGSLGSGPLALKETVARAWIDAINYDQTTAQKLLINGITMIERDAYLAVEGHNNVL